MKKNLSDYVVLNKGVISDELCDRTVKELEESPSWRQHTFTKYANGELVNIAGETEPNQHDADLPTVIPDLMKVYWETIYKYIAKDTDLKWFTSWEGFDPIKFIQYTPGTEMRVHCDHIHSMFDGRKKGIPILTVIAQFNDAFKGGEFVMFEDEVISFNKGDIIVFPSNFLFPQYGQLFPSIRFLMTV
jgi:hypothetical protein